MKNRSDTWYLEMKMLLTNECLQFWHEGKEESQKLFPEKDEQDEK
jgi:hypothetical protein